MLLNNNEYYVGLTNLALYIAMYTTNRSDRTQSVINTFTTEPLEYGDTKIFRSVPFPEVSDYSKNSSLLENNVPSFVPTGETDPVNAIEETISVDNFKLIKCTINKEHLKMAIKSEYGAGEFVAIVMSNIEAAKANFLYDLLINQLYDAEYCEEVEVELLDLTTQTLPSEIEAGEILNQKKICEALQKQIDSMTHYTNLFNKYGLTQSLNLSDMRLIVFQPYKNQAVNNLFSELLNSKYISENMPRPEMLTIPEQKCSEATHYNDKYVCVLAHKNFIQIFFKLIYMGEFFDPSNLNTNNFLHFWYGLGQVKQLPNCLIKIKAGA